MLNKIFQGTLELILAVAIILIFDKIMVMSWRGIKSGVSKLKNRRQQKLAVVES